MAEVEREFGLGRIGAQVCTLFHNVVRNPIVRFDAALAFGYTLRTQPRMNNNKHNAGRSPRL
jgi:hypothetical protein